MSWKFTLISKNTFWIPAGRSEAKKKYREKFQLHGINHHFLSPLTYNAAYTNIIVRVKTQEDANFVMLVFPGEFEIFESPDV